jgi:hypothetical protein
MSGLEDLQFRACGYVKGIMRPIRKVHIFHPFSRHCFKDDSAGGSYDIATTLCGKIYRPGMKTGNDSTEPIFPAESMSHCKVCEKLRDMTVEK